jgi:membrane associated rhomboid family serine protease
MGFYDRDYYRAPPARGGLAMPRLASVNTWLIIINVVVFLVDPLCNYACAEWGYFSVTTAIDHMQLWRVITFQFLHANLTHIFLNMLGLYFFGPMVESYLGSWRYLGFYLLSGIGGPVGYLVLSFLGFLHQGPDTPMIGASAGIFGVLVAAARIAPDVGVIVLVFPMRLRQAAWLFLAIAAYTVLTSGNNAGGQAAHLGGAAVGGLLIYSDRWLGSVLGRRRRFG